MKRSSEDYSFLTEVKSGDEAKRKKKSRWAVGPNERVFIPGLSTTLPANLTPEQEKIHIMTLQVEEISRRLRSGDLGIPPNPGDRSPSPEPLYNNEGKRMNTREVRVRKKLEEERHSLIQKISALSPEYKPPNDYKPPLIRYNDRVVIPQEEYPHINFMGLLIGPRGNTLKQLEKETGTKIIIRGRGSVKEGKLGGRKDGMPYPGEDDPLHAWITASSEEIVAKAKLRIEDIIKQGIEIPDDENDLRKQQLRELALINGTYKENEGLIKLRQIAEAGTIATNNIICGLCGGTGHLAMDCKVRRECGYSVSEAQSIAAAAGDVPPPGVESGPRGPMACGTLATFYASGVGGISSADRVKMDSEYSALMVELGVKSSDLAAPGSSGSNKFVDRGGSRGVPPVAPPQPPSAVPMPPYGPRPPYSYPGPPGPPNMQMYPPQPYHPPPPAPGNYGYPPAPMPPGSYPPPPPQRSPYLPPPPPWSVHPPCPRTAPRPPPPPLPPSGPQRYQPPPPPPPPTGVWPPSRLQTS